MKLPRLHTIIFIPLALFVAFYLSGVVANLLDNVIVEPLSTSPPGSTDEIAIFGASGTAGDGILNFISSSDISEESSMHWAQEKVRAEKNLFSLAESTNLRVIAYRPDYIGPTEEQAHLGQILLYWFFAPVRAAVRARQIGEAMLEITARGDELMNAYKRTSILSK